MKFKVGDKVRIKKDLDSRKRYEISVVSEMEAYKGKIAEIVRVRDDNSCVLDIDKGRWFWSDDTFELVKEKKFTKADLKHGDKCTLKNGQVVFVDKTSNYGFDSIDKQLRYFYDDVSIVKVERPVKYETMFERKFERKEEILDETEKRYLANIIRPFRGKVETIKKVAGNKEYISIELKDEASIDFPYFKEDTMYKGMTKDKEYTLKELGI